VIQRQSGSSVQDGQEEPNFWSSGGDNARFVVLASMGPIINDEQASHIKRD